MAQDKSKQVSQITDMEVDFAQWFTDVCIKAELVDYSGVKGLFIIHPRVPAPEGKGPCGGLRSRVRVGHAGGQRAAG